MVRSKICGITRIEDALVAAEAGADAIGLVFYEGSPRAVTPAQAREIIAALPPFVTSVGLFVDCPAWRIDEILASVPLDMLQFHGQESPEDCARHGRPWFKALRVRPGDDVQAQARAYAGASAILLDSFVPGVPGGTGQMFDWSQIPAGLCRPLILAGGLTVENVEQAIHQVRPYAVDVSGGVELARGIKDPERVRAFVARVRNRRPL